MAMWNLKSLQQHEGHDLELVSYMGEPVIECNTCGEVLLEFHEEENILTLGPKDEE